MQKATIKLNGSVVFEEVSVHIQIHMEGGLRSWDGEMTLPNGKHLEQGVTYQLVLDDGRCGDFFAINTQIRSGSRSTRITFTGTGPLQ